MARAFQRVNVLTVEQGRMPSLQAVIEQMNRDIARWKRDIEALHEKRLKESDDQMPLLGRVVDATRGLMPEARP